MPRTCFRVWIVVLIQLVWLGKVSRSSYAATQIVIARDLHATATRLAGIGIQARPRYEVVLRRRDCGLLEEKLRKANALVAEKTSTECAIRTDERTATESIEQMLTAQGVRRYRRREVAGQLEVYVPTGLAKVYDWELFDSTRDRTLRTPCMECIGSGHASGTLRLPAKSGLQGTSQPQTLTVQRWLITRSQHILERELEVRHQPFVLARHSDRRVQGLIGPIRNKVLVGQRLCEIVFVSVDVEATAKSTVGVHVLSDPGFDRRSANGDCSTSLAEYKREGSEHKKEVDQYAQALADRMVERLHEW